jgi:hypothetical protein
MPSLPARAPGSAESGPDRLTAAAAPSPLVRLPLLLAAVLFGFLLLPRVRDSEGLTWAFAGAGAGLLVWFAVLSAVARGTGRALTVQFVPPVRQHYIQACVQLVVYAYWGWYWRPIYDQTALILSQFVFVFAFDALFSWSRGRTWRLTSGPVPIVMSTNLFIWFVDSWFALQFAMIVAGLLGKEFIKWEKDGRRTHIFNPSGFGLLVTVLALIATGTTDDITLARPLANTIDGPPHIYLVLFALGLVVQKFFAVTLMTMCAVMATVALTLAYHAITGVHLFTSSNLPAAGFLGMHLLMTDPSTSPKTNLGKAIFGTGYGVGYSTLFLVLGWAGNLELYAKLFPVPILNTAVIALDRFASRGAAGRFNTWWQTVLRPASMNLIHMGIWIVFFSLLIGTGYLSKEHEGQSVAFWKQAAAEGKPLADMRLRIVAIGSATPDSFNEVGILCTDPEYTSQPPSRHRPSAEYWFGLAVTSGSLHGARNAVIQYLFTDRSVDEQTLNLAMQVVGVDADASPGGLSTLLLAYASETGRHVPRDIARSLALYRSMSEASPFARKGITRLALAPGGEFLGVSDLVDDLERDAAAGDAESCWYLAYMYARGRGVDADREKSRALLQRACDLGLRRACDALRVPELPPFEPLPAENMHHPAWSTAYP